MKNACERSIAALRKRHDPPSRIEERYRNSAHLSAAGAHVIQRHRHAALSMMAGLSSAGLPLPVQFIGRYFAEARLFRIDRAWKRKTGADEKHLRHLERRDAAAGLCRWMPPCTEPRRGDRLSAHRVVDRQKHRGGPRSAAREGFEAFRKG